MKVRIHEYGPKIARMSLTSIIKEDVQIVYAFSCLRTQREKLHCSKHKRLFSSRFSREPFDKMGLSEEERFTTLLESELKILSILLVWGSHINTVQRSLLRPRMEFCNPHRSL